MEKDAKRHRVPKEEILDTFYQEMYDAIVALGQVADEFFGTGFVRQIHVSIPYDLQNAIQNFGWSQNNLPDSVQGVVLLLHQENADQLRRMG